MTSLSGITSRHVAPAPSAVDGAPRQSKPECQRLGSWGLTRLIHRGKWTTLYRARSIEALEGPGCYVVKTMSAPGASGSVANAMLRREAAVAKGVSHPNLTTVLAAHLRGETPHLLLPFLEGASIGQLLNTRQQPLPVGTALWIVRQLSAALGALHEAGWLHGQVRPEHAIVSPQGHATLLDLTLCRRLESDECLVGQSPLESTSYASPESLAARGTLTVASDTYALGLLLYELLAGCPAFQSSDPARLAEMHRRCAPPDVRSIRPDVAPEVTHLLRLMLAKEPLRRPSDAELGRWLTELEIAALA